MRSMGIGFGALVCTIAVAGRASGVTIGNLTRTGTVGSLGEMTVGYWGQSFIAPDAFAESLSFQILTGIGQTKFRVLLTEVGGSDAYINGTDAGVLYPTKVLFESGTLSFPPDPTFSTYNDITLPLGHTELTPGQKYAFVLDAVIEYDGSPNVCNISANDLYPDGHLFEYGVIPSGDRNTNFANTNGWYSWRNPPHAAADIAFNMTFVPEPAGLMLVALGGMGLRRRLGGITCRCTGPRPRNVYRDSNGRRRGRGQ